MFNRRAIPVDTPFPPALARMLLDACGDALHAAMVLLPSSRTCGSLRHTLLEASGRDGLLLPRIVTPSELITDLGERMGHFAPAVVPRTLRAAVLAPHLCGLDWLRDRPGAAAGLAEEFLRIFDELRRHELDPDELDDGGPAAPELLRRDVSRVREVWRLYRAVVPHDDLDRERHIIDAACAVEPWPGSPVGDLFIAGFSDVPPLTARLLRAVARSAERATLVTSDAGDAPLTKLFLAAFSDRDAPTHPLSPDRRTAALLASVDLESLGRDTRAYPERLADLGEPSAILVSGDEPLLYPCADPEQESRLAAHLVVEQLRRDPRSRIAVATADRPLARRIADQLADAGLDLDVTDGEPLSTHADGRLAWQLLRSALTDLRPEALLELVTHPHVDFGRGRGDHARRSLSFEKELLRGQVAGAGLDGLRRRAADRDEAVRRKHPDARSEMTELVDDLAAALGPLLELAGGGEAPVETHVAALREAWAVAAPAESLSGEDAMKPARRALSRLLDELTDAAGVMKPLSAAAFSALLARLLGQVQVRPHRSVHLPVQVTGLLEARLESYDLLVLAGLGEGVFPDEPRRRTLLLGRPWRERNGLPDWRWDLGLDAELFLRLLHNGRRVAVTWSREREGQPALPSPLIGRLLLALPDRPAAANPAPLWRRDDDGDNDMIATAQAAFSAEPRARPVHARTRPLTQLSHKALSTFRDCPYRYLLQGGYGLREEDAILEELRKQDYGSIAHDALRRFLADGGPGERALRAGDRDAALDALRRATVAAFTDQITDLPQRRLWEAAFLAMADEIVDAELVRARQWRPVCLEGEFDFTLGELRDWLEAADAATPSLTDDEVAIVVAGRLDRVDLDADGATVRVIDYKTGRISPVKWVTDGDDLQLAVYALAVRLGKVHDAPDGADLSGAYYGLKPGAVGHNPSKPHLKPDHDLARDGTTLLEAALAMADRDGTFDLPPDVDPDHQNAPCQYCVWRGVCRVDEVAAAGEVGP